MNDFIQPGYKYFSPEFSENDLNVYRLSIGVAPDGFSFLIQNEEKEIVAIYSATFKKAVTWEDVMQGIEKVLNDFSWLKKPMKKKIVLLESPKFTLIPFSLYEKEAKRKYLELNYPLNNEDRIHYDVVKEFYTYIIYAQNNKLRQMIDQYIAGLQWHHYTTEFLRHAASYTPEKYIAVDVRNSRVYVSAFSNDRLVFCNEFHYNTKEDFVYYIILTYRSLGYDPKNIPLNLTGLIDYESGIFSLLKRYISTINFADTSEIYYDDDNENTVYQYQFEILKSAAFANN